MIRQLMIAAVVTFSYHSQAANLKCIGTEPFWSLKLGEAQAEFNFDDRNQIFKPVSYEPASGVVIDYVMAFTSQKPGLSGFVVKAQGEPCSDGMSDNEYPYSVHFFVNGQPFTGCCERK